MQRLQAVSGQLTPALKYTVPGGCLTKEQRLFYQQNGYILVKKFIKDLDIDKWTTRFLEYCEGKAQKLPGMQIVRDISIVKGQNKHKTFKGQEAITKLQDWQNDETLFTFCTNQALQPYLRSFCGNNIKSVHTMFINKPPNMGSSSRHPLHQDLAYFPFRPADRIVAAWTALQNASQSNGALMIIPGSHKGQFLPHGYPKDTVNKAYYGITDELKMKPEFVPMQKGDIIFFHPLLIHGSGPNTSTGFRKSICCHFADASCKYIDVKGTYHQTLAQEIVAYAGKKFNGPIQYQDIWKMKSKIVLGQLDPEGL